MDFKSGGVRSSALKASYITSLLALPLPVAYFLITVGGTEVNGCFALYILYLSKPEFSATDLT